MKTLKNTLKKIFVFILYKSIFKYIFTNQVKIRYEEKQFIQMISSLQISSQQKILDIGCGYGNKLKVLDSMGIKALGIDVNPDAVKANLDAGFDCMTVDDFKGTSCTFDVLLMSHIIEHFQPNQLLNFINAYLGRLKPGGYLIILTPLYSPNFFDDFDHVKPYHPTGIFMVFCDNTTQVQFHSSHQLKLIDLRYRRTPLRLVHCRGLFFYRYTSLPLIINNILAILFNISFGLIGRKSGWLGLYKKSTNPFTGK
ncbi:MAG: class I SAM-dependent methyltransferase [Thermincola sp.]|jgi:SAM-dependent methyltransferase|nr:class I SAM-dependent methyltransferase [Thermincola sp.]MDT3703451.1 class I SAM-dependent methyltransferase [Thermincola sp.]